MRRLLESTLEETKAGKIAAVRQKLITREHEEIGNRLREYRQQNSFRMYSPKGARDHGYDINRVEMGVAAENPLSGELTPTEVAEWRNKKGDILYKVEGYTEPALGRYGQMIDDPYDGPMDGSHSADSKFIEIKAGDDRNPDEVWKAYQAEQKRLETEVAGDFNQMAAQSRGHLFSLADHPGFFDRPESIEEQKARLAQEKADRVLEQKRQAMLAKAGRRLTGEDVDTTGDLLPGARVDKQGQGSFFSPGGEPGLTHSEAQQRITEAINEKHATFQGDSSSASQGHHDVVRRAESAFRGVFAGRETAFGNTAVDRDFYTTQTGRRLAALAQKHGAEVVFFKGDAYAPKGFTYLGRLFLRSNRPEAQLVQTFEHELAHHRANNGNETMAALENEVDLLSPAAKAFRATYDRLLGEIGESPLSNAGARGEIAVHLASGDTKPYRVDILQAFRDPQKAVEMARGYHGAKPSPTAPGETGPTKTFHASNATITAPGAAQPEYKLTAHHATPHDVDRFSTDKIGTGEGAQAYGWGLYMAESESVSGVEGDYYKKFKAQHGKANAYTVELNADPEDMLDWDKPLSEQSEKVQQAVARVMQEEGLDAVPGTRTGADVYHLLQRYVPGGAEIASNRFEVKGIKGVRYLDQGSRNVPDTTVIERNIERTKTERDYWNQAGGHTAETRKAMLESYAKQISDLERELAEAKNAPPGTYNYVVFNADDIKITHANGQQIPVEHAMKQPQFSLDEEKQGGEGGGVPTRIYHGQKGDESPSGITFWSEDQSVAQSYANTGRSVGGSIGKGKPSVKSKDFTPRNPLDLSSITENTPWEEIRARLVDAGVKEDWLDDRFDSMAAESRPGAAGILDPMWAQDAEGLASELQRLGFDSVKVTEDHKPGWVTFEPSSEANRYSLADEYLPTAEEQAAARPPERDRPAAQIKSEMATAEEALREAVRLKVRPAATPAAKQAALDAMHLATATYRNLRDELLNSPEYIAKQIKRHHDAITEANEILKPTGQAVQADSFPNLNEMEDKLAPEQLERLSRLHAEIGSAQSEMGQMPGKLVTGIYAKMQREGVIPKAAPMAQGAGRTLDQMTERLRAAGQDSPNVPLSERLAIGRRVADAAEGTKDWLAKAQARTVASWKAGVDSIMHVPVDTEFMAQKRSKFQYDQQTSVEREAWAREFARKVPNPDRQKALALWLEASGDETLLQSQAKMAPKPYDRLFDLATKLTPGEKRIALDAKENWQLKLADAIKTGLVEKGRLDYIPQVWETPPKVETGDAPDPFGERKGGTAGNPYSKLDTRDPFFSFQRQTSTYFDGIMAGGKPRNLSLGYLVTHYDAAFHQALGSRLFVGGLQEACARDGAPVTKISGSATRKANGETGTATFVNAKSAGADSVTADGRPYRAYDHPSLKGWKFVTKDAQGNPTFVRGDMLIHPDHFAEVKNMLESPEWTRKGLGAAALRASSFLKSSKFIGPFHLVTEALHATFHGVNPSPWGLPEINLKDPRQARLAAHMTLGFGRQRELFEEGNGSHGGIWAKVPGLGEAVVRMNQFTFDEYIPRLKMKVGLAVLERNTARYAKELTPDQIAEVTGRQMDAAFGGQNFEMQGRSKSTLAVMRLALVAPDFLISRAKVIGQALKPYNQEQRVFLLAQAAGVYALCRVANSLFSDDHDPHFEPRNWDRVIIGKRGYAARFIVSDAANLARDLMGLGSFSQHGVPFVTGRLGVLPKMGMETLSGKDLFTGQNKDGLFDTDNPMLKAFSIVLKDVTEWSTPMALDSVMPGSTKKGQTPLGATGAALFGVSSRKESPATQVWNQARKFNLEGTDPKATAYQRMRDQETGTPSVYRGLNNLLDADDTDGAKEEIARLKAEGRTLAQIRQHYERHTYFTGSARRETAFFASLDAGAKDTYKAAKTEQAERAQKLAAALR